MRGRAADLRVHGDVRRAGRGHQERAAERRDRPHGRRCGSGFGLSDFSVLGFAFCRLRFVVCILQVCALRSAHLFTFCFHESFPAVLDEQTDRSGRTWDLLPWNWVRGVSLFHWNGVWPGAGSQGCSGKAAVSVFALLQIRLVLACKGPCSCSVRCFLFALLVRSQPR